MQAKVPSPDPPPEREILISGTENEADFNPYTVRGEILSGKCPQCGKALPQRAELCTHCGCDLAARARVERTFEPVAKQWENGWTLRRRFGLFAILQGINVAVLVATLVMQGWASVSVPSLLFIAGLQAFILGTYDRLTMARNSKGKVLLTRTWRFAFVERPPQTIRWKEHESVRAVLADEFDALAWTMAAFLLLFGVVPGVLFWWFVLASDRYDVALCKDHGYPATILLCTSDAQRANQIVTAIHEATELPILE